jgi:hypothetical protein
LAVEHNGSANSPDGGICPGRSEREDVSAALGSVAGGVSGSSAMGGRLMRRLGRAASAGGEAVPGIELFGAVAQYGASSAGVLCAQDVIVFQSRWGCTSGSPDGSSL